MKQASILKRLCAIILAVLTAAAAFPAVVSAEGVSMKVSLGQAIITAYSGINTGEREILTSDFLSSSSVEYTVPGEEDFPVTVDAEAKTVYAEDLICDGYVFTPSSARIVSAGGTEACAFDGITPFSCGEILYTAEVKYYLCLTPDAELQKKFLNGPYYLIQGIKDLDDLDECRPTLEELTSKINVFDELMGLVSGLSIGGWSVETSDAKIAVDALSEQVKTNGDLDLVIMLREYENYPSKSGYLFDHGEEIRATAVETYGYIETIVDDKMVNFVLENTALIERYLPYLLDYIPTIQEAMDESIPMLEIMRGPVEDDWGILEDKNDPFRKDLSDYELTQLDVCVLHGAGASLHEDEAVERLSTGISVTAKRKAIAPHDHEFGEWKTDVEPTCTESGEKSRVCSLCNSVDKSTVPATGHDLISHEGKAATCTEPGFADYCTCSRCDFTTYEVSPALGHSPAEQTEENEVPPTCTAAGSFDAVVYCERCGEELSRTAETASALGHNWNEGVVTVEPTETEDGLREYTCLRCGQTREEAIPSPGHVHSYSVVSVTEPSCTEAGYTTYRCVCGDSFNDDFIPELGHDLTVFGAQVPGCETVGWEEYAICSRCGFSTYSELSAVGHSFGEWTESVAPSCTEPGEKTRTCTVCGKEETDQIDPAGHDFVSVTTPPKCTEQGFTTHTCSRCGEVRIDSFVDSIGHSLIHHDEKAPGCTEPGWEEYDSCSRCDFITYEEIPALGHDYSDWVETSEPTCTEFGTKTRTCVRCGVSESEKTDPAGHDFVAVLTPPGCVEGGYTTFVCSRCSDSYVDLYTDPLGHDFTSWSVTKEPTCSAEGEITRSCIRCGASESETIAPLDHIYTSVVTAPTCTERGYTTHVCSRCGDFYVDSYVEATGHRYGKDDAVCPVCGAVNPDHKEPLTFIDVPSDAYYAGPVSWAVENGITAGTGNGRFSPDAGCTRGQVVTFLWRSAGSPKPASSRNPFSDVKPGDYFYEAVLWAVGKGITLGTSSTTFSPDVTCTRGQIVTFLHRSKGSPATNGGGNPFSDVKASDYYYNAVLWAVGNDITKGTSAVTFSPNATCTRAQIVTFMSRSENN